MYGKQEAIYKSGHVGQPVQRAVQQVPLGEETGEWRLNSS